MCILCLAATLDRLRLQEALLQTAVQIFGHTDVLVNNARSMPLSPREDLSEIVFRPTAQEL